MNFHHFVEKSLKICHILPISLLEIALVCCNKELQWEECEFSFCFPLHVQKYSKNDDILTERQKTGFAAKSNSHHDFIFSGTIVLYGWVYAESYMKLALMSIFYIYIHSDIHFEFLHWICMDKSSPWTSWRYIFCIFLKVWRKYFFCLEYFLSFHPSSSIKSPIVPK